MPNTQNNCDCKKMTCSENCTRTHTHKGFFCEKCEPERYKELNTQKRVEEIKEYNITFSSRHPNQDDEEVVSEIISQALRQALADNCKDCYNKGYEKGMRKMQKDERTSR